jgi:hypothetical protein
VDLSSNKYTHSPPASVGILDFSAAKHPTTANSFFIPGVPAPKFSLERYLDEERTTEMGSNKRRMRLQKRAKTCCSQWYSMLETSLEYSSSSRPHSREPSSRRVEVASPSLRSAKDGQLRINLEVPGSCIAKATRRRTDITSLADSARACLMCDLVLSILWGPHRLLLARMEAHTNKSWNSLDFVDAGGATDNDTICRRRKDA